MSQTDQLMQLLISTLFLLVAVDAAAYMLGRTNFPVTRWVLRTLWRTSTGLVGGLLQWAGREIRQLGGGGRRPGRR